MQERNEKHRDQAVYSCAVFLSKNAEALFQIRSLHDLYAGEDSRLCIFAAHRGIQGVFLDIDPYADTVYGVSGGNDLFAGGL